MDMIFARQIRKVEVENRSKYWKETVGLRQVKELLGDFHRSRSKVCRSIFRRVLGYWHYFLRDSIVPLWEIYINLGS